MRKIVSIITVFIALVGLFVFVQPVAIVQAKDPFADACTSGGGGSTICNNQNKQVSPLTGSGGALTKAADLLTLVGGVMAVIFVITGGIKYITSNGDSAQAAGGKNTIIYGLIGLVVLTIARTIVSFVVTRI